MVPPRCSVPRMISLLLSLIGLALCGAPAGSGGGGQAPHLRRPAA